MFNCSIAKRDQADLETSLDCNTKNIPKLSETKQCSGDGIEHVAACKLACALAKQM